MDMHKMDCKSCTYGKHMKPGVYKTVYGSMVIGGNGTYECKAGSIKNMSVIGDEMYCSQYKEGEKISE